MPVDVEVQSNNQEMAETETTMPVVKEDENINSEGVEKESSLDANSTTVRKDATMTNENGDIKEEVNGNATTDSCTGNISGEHQQNDDESTKDPISTAENAYKEEINCDAEKDGQIVSNVNECDSNIDKTAQIVASIDDDMQENDSLSNENAELKEVESDLKIDSPEVAAKNEIIASTVEDTENLSKEIESQQLSQNTSSDNAKNTSEEHPEPIQDSSGTIIENQETIKERVEDIQTKEEFIDVQEKDVLVEEIIVEKSLIAPVEQLEAENNEIANHESQTNADSTQLQNSDTAEKLSTESVEEVTTIGL